MNNVRLTIGLVMRERFSCTQETLTALYRYTPAPFDLVLVDCAMPRRYREQVNSILRGRPEVRIITLDHYVLPNAARNIVIAESRTDYVCLFENDNLVHDDWLTPLLETAESLSGGGIVAPLLFWHDPSGNKIIHYDHLLDTLEITTEAGRVVRRVSAEPGFMRGPELTVPLPVNSTEAHVFLGSRESLLRIVPLDEEVSTREHYDLTASIREAGLPIYLDPRSRVTFIPSRLEPEDYDFWFFAKDIARSRTMNLRVAEKWRIEGMRNSMNFVTGLHYDIEDEIRTLWYAGEVPPFYFHVLQRNAECDVRVDGEHCWIEHPSGAKIRCNSSGLAVWKLCDGTTSFERMAFAMKRQFPEHAGTMIQDLAEVVESFLKFGVVTADPA